MPVYEATESVFENIPEGEVVPVKVMAIEFKEEWTYPALAWKFQVISGEWEGFTVNDQCSPKFNIDPPSKLYEWSVLLLGRSFDVGEFVDTDDLIGLQCRIEIGHKPDRKDPDKVWMRVETMLPAKGTGTATAEDVFG